MRISDWSSDVCSSDLGLQGHEDRRFAQPAAQPDANDTEDPTQQERQAPGVVEDLRRGEDLRQRRGGQGAKQIAEGQASLEETQRVAAMLQRGMFGSSAERRVGKEWVSTFRSRGGTGH